LIIRQRVVHPEG
jgi:hypothetical protein